MAERPGIAGRGAGAGLALAKDPATAGRCREFARQFDWDESMAPLLERLYWGALRGVRGVLRLTSQWSSRPTAGRATGPPAEALAEQTLAPERFEVVVVDDCSTVDIVAAVERLAAELPYRLRARRTEMNGGPAVARNLGWQKTSAPIVAFLDDDCDPSAGWLQAGLAAFGGQPGAGVIQGRTHVPEGVTLGTGSDWYIWRVIEGPTPFFEGCNLFFRREALQVTGGFDEEIAYHGEDISAGWRVVEAGFERDSAPRQRSATRWSCGDWDGTSIMDAWNTGSYSARPSIPASAGRASGGRGPTGARTRPSLLRWLASASGRLAVPPGVAPGTPLPVVAATLGTRLRLPPYLAHVLAGAGGRRRARPAHIRGSLEHKVFVL